MPLVRTVWVCGLIVGCYGCGSTLKQSESTALRARLDLIEGEHSDQQGQLKEMSARITELENLVLKQKNEIKKLKVAKATAPKTLVPVESPASAPAWSEEPVMVVEAAPAKLEDTTQQSGDEEPRPLLKLYGSTSPSVPPPGGGSSLKPASLLAEAASIGSFVPLTLPSLPGSLPAVDDALGGKVVKPKEDKPADPYEQGVIKYQSNEWSNAILYFDIYLKHSPMGSHVMNALFLKAESLYQIGKYLDAIGQFELVLQRYPKSGRAADTKLRIARCNQKLGDKTKAASMYKQIALEYPSSKHAAKAGKLLQAMK
jgi:TolA-binding protein